ncbi:uncharacterized protein LOC143458949 [Clavelina lepadiformis]|uniref:uncharacterized protein LOC143458949 n=1 Tax=Clavelina lepadiformis TaxID=159417 RepID=UPI0040427217
MHLINLMADKRSRRPSDEGWARAKNPKLPRRGGVQHPGWINSDGSFLRHPYGQSNLFQQSMAVCFVCGNATCEDNMVQLYSRCPRSRVDTPFFPFLEYHDPAPGADAMKDDWSVTACFVCNALLCQQWESFERTRMPISKRLYWLKRPNGCEIRQPVSQIELEEILNEHSRDNYVDKDDCMSEDDQHDVVPASKKSSRPSTPCEKQIPRNDKPAGASSTSHLNETEVCDESKPAGLVCYSCGTTDAIHNTICPVHCKPSYEQMRAGVPFYPTILLQNEAEGSKVLFNSITFLCITCLPKFKPGWHPMQRDFMKQDITKSVLPRIPLPEMVLCYVCGSNVSTKFNDNLVTTITDFGNENTYFAKLFKLKQKQGSVPLSFGFTYVCNKCSEEIRKEISECKDTADA